MNLPRILIIEDDQQISSTLAVCLHREGYRPIECFDGKTGLDLALRERPDLLILDLDLPVLGGMQVCSELRRLRFESPILMLTGRALVDDRVMGLDAGADDYLAKPFVPREFLARVRALLRRKERIEVAEQVLEFGGVRIDLAEKRATRDGEPLTLTKTEYLLFELLAKSLGQPVSRETILDVIWGYTRFPSTRTVDTHIWRLRKKIGDGGERPRWIKSLPGRGYYLDLTASPAIGQTDPENPTSAT
jgi:two-component system, OmpR family, response regulator MprA